MRRRKTNLLSKLESLEIRQLLSTIYVSAAAPAAGADGASWTTAYTDLQQALGIAVSGDSIEVGQGTYKPTTGTDRTATFQLKSGVAVKGGYAGYGAGNPDARNTTVYPTVLSGDIGTSGDNIDNSYHVVVGSGTDNTAYLDGFQIMDGNANGAGYLDDGGGLFNNAGSPSIHGCTFTANSADRYGGAIANFNSPYPIITDSAITQNHADRGGGIYNNNSSLSLTESTLSGNTATNSGGGIYNTQQSILSLTAVSIVSNSASNSGGAILDGNASATMVNTLVSGNSAARGIINGYNDSLSLINCTITGNTNHGVGLVSSYYSTVYATNSIIWGNDILGRSPFTNSGGTITASYSDISGGFTGTGNIDADPLLDPVTFVPAPDSPVVDAGNNAAVPLNVHTDLGNFNRFQDVPTSAHTGVGTVPIVDMGAFETNAYLAANTTGPYSVIAGQTLTLQGLGSSDVAGTLSYSWDINNDGTFGDLTGANPVFNSSTYPAGTVLNISLQVTDADNSSIVSPTTTITIVPPTLYVDASATGANTGLNWADAFTDLQSALNLATSGVTINLAQGTYVPGTNRTDSFVLKSGVTLDGGFAGDIQPNPAQRDPTTYVSTLSGNIGVQTDDADNSYHVLTVRPGDAPSTIDGVTITSGYAVMTQSPADTSTDFGGGILNSGDLLISNSSVSSNTASYGGGAIFNYSGSTLQANNVYFGYNDSASGGGAISANGADLTITYSILTGNTAGYGGAIYGYGSANIYISNTNLEDNTANTGGGAIQIWGYDTNLTLSDCTLSGNSAGYGGAISTYGQTTISYSTITNNSASDYAGGIDSEGLLNISGSTISGNTSGGDAGGIDVRYGGNLYLYNSTVNGNSSQGNGGGILVDQGYLYTYQTNISNNHALN